MEKEIKQVPKERYDLKILQALRRIIRAVEIHSKRLSQTYQLTTPQLVCLNEIHTHGPLTSRQLAQNVYLSPSTVVGIVDRLEGKSLIKRERSQVDRRQVELSVTEEGTEMIKSAPSPLQDKLAEALTDLSDLEQSTIYLSLERIVELMEARDIDASPVLDTLNELKDSKK